MGTMSRDQDIITGTKIALAFSLDPKTGRAGDEQGPLVVFLIVRFVHWRGLTGRDDPLDPHAPSREQLREELLVRLTGKVVEEIDHSCTLSRDTQSIQLSQVSAQTTRFAGRVLVQIAAISLNSEFETADSTDFAD
jgi:hypothetical protein